MANEAKFEYKIQLDLIDLASSKAGRLSQQLDAIDKTALRANQAMARVGNQLSVASTAGIAGFRNTAQQVESLRVSLLNVEAAAGNAGNNVAQVGSAAPKFNMLNMSVQQVARELPALAISANTFFLAISNNLPILADAISNARKENAALIAQGKTAVPVWKQVGSAILGWQTGLVIGVTVLSMYGRQIGEAIAKTLSWNSQLNISKETLKQLNDVQSKGLANAQEELAKLDVLYRASQSEARSRDERRLAAEKLQKLYPAFFENLTKEEIMLGKGAKAYNLVRDSIIQAAQAQAAFTKISENATKRLELTTKEATLTKQLEVAKKQLDQVSGQPIIGDAGADMFVRAGMRVKSLESDLKSIREEISLIDQANKKLADSVSIDAFEDKSGTNDTLNRNLSTIGGITNKINELKEAQNKASIEQATNIEREIRLWEQKLNLIRREIAERNAGNLAQAGSSLSVPSISPLPVPIKPVLPESFEAQDMADIQRRWKDSLKILVEDAEISGRQISGLLTGSISNFASGFGEALASGDGLEIFRSLLISVMDMLQQFGSALIAAGTASLAFQSLFVNPIAGIIAGSALIATAAAAKAALQQATAMANGGIVSGPTLALVGEYSGASNNPEVVAPLNKLKSMIEPAYQSETTGEVRFVIRGEVLEGILHKMNHKRSRTR